MFRLTWYILKLHIGPLLFGTFAVVFIFLLQFIFKTTNELVGKGLGYDVIGKLIFYHLAWMVVLAVPMGVLVATLMAYGKLSGNNELTIIKSGGGSAIRAMMPAIIGGAFLFAGLYFFNDRILPKANQRAAALQNDIRQLNTTFAVDAGRFTRLQGYSIFARKVNRARNELLDVTIYSNEEQMTNVINAKSATLVFNHDYSRLVMALRQGEIQQINRSRLGDFRRLSFTRHQVVIPVSGYRFTRSDPSAYANTDRTMNIDQMRAIGDTALLRSELAAGHIDSILSRRIGASDTLSILPPDTVLSRRDAVAGALAKFPQLRAQLELESAIRSSELKQANQYWVEIHKKYSIPAACFVFVFVGAPLGIVVRKGNFGVSAAIALGFFVIYWAFLILGEKLADRALVSPFLAMWMANFVIGIMGLYLTVLVSRETVTFDFDFKGLRRLFRRGDPGTPTTS